MAFMDQFRQSPQQGGLSDIIGMARKLAGNDPRSALQQMSASGMTCRLPDGRTMPISSLVSMAEGKSAQQLLDSLGLK